METRRRGRDLGERTITVFVLPMMNNFGWDLCIMLKRLHEKYSAFYSHIREGDKDVVGRFINQNPAEKFAFGQVYETVENEDRLVTVGGPPQGVQVRGGTVLVSAIVQAVPSVIFASSESMTTGIHRVICRLFVPGVRGTRNKLGSVGLICANNSTAWEGPANVWTHRQDLSEPWITEYQFFGVMYNADERALVIHNCSYTTRSIRFASTRTEVAESAGDLYIGVELTAK